MALFLYNFLIDWGVGFYTSIISMLLQVCIKLTISFKSTKNKLQLGPKIACIG